MSTKSPSPVFREHGLPQEFALQATPAEKGKMPAPPPQTEKKDSVAFVQGGFAYDEAGESVPAPQYLTSEQAAERIRVEVEGLAGQIASIEFGRLTRTLQCHVQAREELKALLTDVELGKDAPLDFEAELGRLVEPLLAKAFGQSRAEVAAKASLAAKPLENPHFIGGAQL